MDQTRQRIHAEYAYSHGYFGAGITVAILDTGIAEHPDLSSKNSFFIDFVNKQEKRYDDNGHGTHVAGIIGGDGKMSMGKYAGIAPKSNLLICKVLDKKGNGTVQTVTEAIYYLIANKEQFRVRILNISIGMTEKTKAMEQNQLLKAVEDAWNQGIVVVAAAGNNGPLPSSVTIPGISRKIITVGCCDDGNLPLGQSLRPGYSGCGPTRACIIKPELVAPGTNIVSCGTDKKQYYLLKSGTSMATPVVSGSICLLLSKYPHLSPKEVKLRLYERAVDLHFPKEKQGWGMVDIKELLC